MLQLGYTKYTTRGGDIGTIIARAMGSFYLESYKTSHFNYIRGTPLAKYDTSTLTERKGRVSSEQNGSRKKEGRGCASPVYHYRCATHLKSHHGNPN
jgi:hypothetical protein